MTITRNTLSPKVEEVVIAQAAVAMGITNQTEKWRAYEDAKVAIRRVCDEVNDCYEVAVRYYAGLVGI